MIMFVGFNLCTLVFLGHTSPCIPFSSRLFFRSFLPSLFIRFLLHLILSTLDDPFPASHPAGLASHLDRMEIGHVKHLANPRVYLQVPFGDNCHNPFLAIIGFGYPWVYHITFQRCIQNFGLYWLAPLALSSHLRPCGKMKTKHSNHKDSVVLKVLAENCISIADHCRLLQCPQVDARDKRCESRLT